MREIKFRAWIRQGEWDEAGENQAYEMCYDLAFEEFELMNDLLAGVENIMQYTGLKDKNGTEIYEGDIVKIFNREANKATIQWNGLDCAFTLKWITSLTEDTEGFIAHVDTRGIEVIGNVYENPELMEEQDEN